MPLSADNSQYNNKQEFILKMKSEKLLIMTTLITLLIPVSEIFGNSIREETNYLDKFHAHKIVRKLSTQNIRKIEFLEIIAKNFGYVDNYSLRKGYWKAYLMITSGDIIDAMKGMKKTRKISRKL